MQWSANQQLLMINQSLMWFVCKCIVHKHLKLPLSVPFVAKPNFWARSKSPTSTTTVKVGRLQNQITRLLSKSGVQLVRWCGAPTNFAPGGRGRRIKSPKTLRPKRSNRANSPLTLLTHWRERRSQTRLGFTKKSFAATTEKCKNGSTLSREGRGTSIPGFIIIPLWSYWPARRRP